MIGNMIKNINVPDEYEEKPRILVLTCENDAYPALDMAGIQRLSYNSWVRVIPLRCLGSMNLIWIADALSKGIDGILLLACRHGDDIAQQVGPGQFICKRSNHREAILIEQRVDGGRFFINEGIPEADSHDIQPFQDDFPVLSKVVDKG